MRWSVCSINYDASSEVAAVTFVHQAGRQQTGSPGISEQRRVVRRWCGSFLREGYLSQH